MENNTGRLTTFATAKGTMAVHNETSDGRFKVLTYMISHSLTESSRRVYATTCRQPCAFADRNGLDTLDLSYEKILAFMKQLDWLAESQANGERYAVQRRHVLKFVKVSGFIPSS